MNITSGLNLISKILIINVFEYTVVDLYRFYFIQNSVKLLNLTFQPYIYLLNICHIPSTEKLMNSKQIFFDSSSRAILLWQNISKEWSTTTNMYIQQLFIWWEKCAELALCYWQITKILHRSSLGHSVSIMTYIHYDNG